MKFYLTVIALFLVVSLSGCSKSIDGKQLQERGGIYYQINDPSPYTGKATDFYENGQKKTEAHYVEGEYHGLFTSWFENGRKELDIHYVDGEMHGLFTSWYMSGQKKVETHYVDGVEQ